MPQHYEQRNNAAYVTIDDTTKERIYIKFLDARFTESGEDNPEGFVAEMLQDGVLSKTALVQCLKIGISLWFNKKACSRVRAALAARKSGKLTPAAKAEIITQHCGSEDWLNMIAECSNASERGVAIDQFCTAKFAATAAVDSTGDIGLAEYKLIKAALKD